MSLVFCLIAASLSFALSARNAVALRPTQEDERLKEFLESISKTTPEGSKVLDHVQGMKPEVNESESTLSLIDVVQNYAFNMGAYNLTVIGWAASRKKVLPGEMLGRWRILLYYKDWQKECRSAEWEYNPETNKLYPFERENAPMFFSLERPVQKKRSQ